MRSNKHTIPSIFNDVNLQQQFEETGYVIIPMLTQEEISELSALFYTYHTDINENSFGASTFLQNKKLKLAIRDALYPLFLSHFEKLFKDYTYFGSSFLYKTPGKNSDLAPHQDWSIVDENQYVAINIWTPLTDTNERNGTLYVLPGSHSRNSSCLRAPTLPFYFQNYEDTVINCSIPTNAKAGDAVILNQSLIHFSTPNTTKSIRLAITSGIKTKNAPMVFHYKNEINAIEQYEMTEDFLLSFDNFQTDIFARPKNGKYIQTIETPNFSMSKSEFIEKFGKKRIPLRDRIFEFFR